MRRLSLLATAVTLFAVGPCPAQEVGHRIVGTLGLSAGVQPPTGLYLTGNFGYYDANQLVDQNGERVPGKFRLTATGGVVGVSFNYRVPRLKTSLGLAFSIPVARISATSDRVPENLERAGLADIYVQPLRLGWRLPQLDLVTGYAFYVPTASIDPDEGPTGVSRAQWTHEIQFGGTIYFDRKRSFQLSALGSSDINGHKIGIDITRGATIQVQGGLGMTFGKIVTIGPVGYALRQVQDDRGTDLPPGQAGARDRAFAAGAEIDVSLHKLRTQLLFRYAHDFEVQTRPLGQILLMGITISAWKPRAR